MELYKRGSKGEMVRQIQLALAGAGFAVIADGCYGQITEEAVRAFQKKKGITADGVVGPKTLALLIPCRFKKSKRTITDIIIHCTATPEGKDYTVDDIRNWHKSQGWSDIGYHYVVRRNGHVEPGRDVDLIGAHCDGHNAHSIGIVYVGGMDRQMKNPTDTRTLAQKAALLSLLCEMRKTYGPKVRIVGHRDYDTKGKACPSFDAKTEYAKI